MNEIQTQPRWLRLGAASQFLGVDPSTLRVWTDAGRVPAFRTPGGHRRYTVVDLRAFLHRSRRERAGRTMLDVIGPHGAKLIESSMRRRVRGQDWRHAFDAEAASAMRRTCHRLMDGLAGYLTGGSRQGAFLRQGERAGRALGTHVAVLGMTPADATRAFLFFRKMVTDTASRHLPISADRKVQSIRRIDAYLNHVLLEMMRAYEARRPRQRGNAVTR